MNLQKWIDLWTEWKLIVRINLIEAQGSQSPITLRVKATQQYIVGVKLKYCHHHPPPALRSASEAGPIHTRSFPLNSKVLGPNESSIEHNGSQDEFNEVQLMDTGLGVQPLEWTTTMFFSVKNP